MKKHFLLLQGVCSPFFSRLADGLEAEGHAVTKVNFNGGDLAYWGLRKSRWFRGRPQEVRDFLDRLYRELGITDQVLFGDRRPVHRPAAEHGEAAGIRTHVFEEGYFRPHWVTLEREGVNGHSLLPRDPDWFRRVGPGVSDPKKRRFSSPFWVRAAHDVAYHAASAVNPFLFPRYRTHAPVSAPVEYLGYARRFALMGRYERRDAALIGELLASKPAYYVLPLQLNSDAQIRDHSRFDGMVEVVEYVLDSFARHAPASSKLVIKNHPLDFGGISYPQVIEGLARRFGVTGRVLYLESGNLEQLVKTARGMVTVNSTAGAVALGLDCPTIALSDPIYNLPGLTFQGSLDAFWREGERPDRELFRHFRNTVIFSTQVNGGFYCRRGIELAVQNCMPLLAGERSPLELLLEEGA